MRPGRKSVRPSRKLILHFSSSCYVVESRWLYKVCRICKKCSADLVKSESQDLYLFLQGVEQFRKLLILACPYGQGVWQSYQTDFRGTKGRRDTLALSLPTRKQGKRNVLRASCSVTSHSKSPWSSLLSLDWASRNVSLLLDLVSALVLAPIELLVLPSRSIQVFPCV